MDSGTTMEGNFRRAIPINENIDGMQIKLLFQDVPPETMTTVIIPAFEKTGSVHRHNAEEAEEQRLRARKKAQDSAKRAAAIGDMDRMGLIVDELIKIKKKDDEDKELAKEKRGYKRFADTCITLLDRCGRVGAAGLRENNELGA